MTAGPLTLYESALYGLLAGTLPALPGATLSALLLKAGHVPSASDHAFFADIAVDELSGTGYARKQVTGAQVMLAAGSVRFTSDTIQFGNPVTLGPARYLVLVWGLPMALKPASPLLGITDLSPSGGAVEAQNSGFSISAPSSGWFSVSQSF